MEDTHDRHAPTMAVMTMTQTLHVRRLDMITHACNKGKDEEHYRNCSLTSDIVSSLYLYILYRIKMIV